VQTSAVGGRRPRRSDTTPTRSIPHQMAGAASAAGFDTNGGYRCGINPEGDGPVKGDLGAAKKTSSRHVRSAYRNVMSAQPPQRTARSRLDAPQGRPLATGVGAHCRASSQRIGSRSLEARPENIYGVPNFRFDNIGRRPRR